MKNSLLARFRTLVSGPRHTPQLRSLRPRCEALETRLAPSSNAPFIIGRGQVTNAVNASAPNGRSVVVWELGTGGGHLQIRAQLYANGRPVGHVIAVTTAAGNKATAPAVAMDARGDFVVVWMANEIDGIEGRRFAASGKPLSPSFRIARDDSFDGGDSSDSYYSPTVAMEPDGRFLINYFDDYVIALQVEGTYDITTLYSAGGKVLAGNSEDLTSDVYGLALAPRGYDLIKSGPVLEHFVTPRSNSTSLTIPPPAGLTADQSLNNLVLAFDAQGNGTLVGQVVNNSNPNDPTTNTTTPIRTLAFTISAQGAVSGPTVLQAHLSPSAIVSGLAVDPRTGKYVVVEETVSGHAIALLVSLSGTVQSRLDLGVKTGSPAVSVGPAHTFFVTYTTRGAIRGRFIGF
jgi:hypothetical protein